jgi:hypothetical protein
MNSPEKEAAKSALARQIAILKSLSDKGIGHPEFITWEKDTREILALYMPGSAIAVRFDEISFDRPPLVSTSDIHMGNDFMSGLASAEECLEEAMEYIENFGMK